MTLHTFKRQLKAYLFHIWCVDKQKEHPPAARHSCGAFVILAPNIKLLTYLLTYLRTNLAVQDSTKYGKVICQEKQRRLVLFNDKNNKNKNILVYCS